MRSCVSRDFGKTRAETWKGFLRVLAHVSMPFSGRTFFLTIQASVLIHGVCYGEQFRDAMNSLIEYRLSKFSECHARIRSTSEVLGKVREAEIEVWVKGDKIRNDVKRFGAVSHSIVNDGVYIVRQAGDKSPWIAPIVEKPDIWQYLGLVHPASIGVSRSGIDICRGGENHFIGKSLLKSANEFKQTLEGDLVKYSIDLPGQLPIGVPIDILQDPGRLASYLEDNPATEVVSLELKYELVFSTRMDGHLVSYYQSQSRVGGGKRTEVSLVNAFANEDVSGIWTPEKSEWELRFDGAVHERTVATVDFIEFSPVDDIIFTAEGVGFEEGSKVRDRSDPNRPKTAVITDGKLVYPKIEDFTVDAVPTSAPDNGRARKNFFGVNLLLISFVVSYLLFRRLRQNVIS